jgi:hypothetical protein
MRKRLAIFFSVVVLAALIICGMVILRGDNTTDRVKSDLGRDEIEITDSSVLCTWQDCAVSFKIRNHRDKPIDETLNVSVLSRAGGDKGQLGFLAYKVSLEPREVRSIELLIPLDQKREPGGEYALIEKAG